MAGDSWGHESPCGRHPLAEKKDTQTHKQPTCWASLTQAPPPPSLPTNRKEMSREQPVLDICALYSAYRGHGKAIDRSDWFFEFRDEVVNRKKKSDNNDANTTASKGRGKGRKNSALSGKVSAQGGSGRGSADDNDADEGGVDPTGGAELLARFEHASDQLASMGYVRPLKRRRRLDGGNAGKGKKAQGPKGAVTRLVFSYTMEDGAL